MLHVDRHIPLKASQYSTPPRRGLPLSKVDDVVLRLSWFVGSKVRRSGEQDGSGPVASNSSKQKQLQEKRFRNRFLPHPFFPLFMRDVSSVRVPMCVCTRRISQTLVWPHIRVCLRKGHCVASACVPAKYAGLQLILINFN